MSTSGQTIKVAAIQAAPICFDLKSSLKKLTELTHTAASAGAQLICFPEGFLSAYPWRYAFDATIGTREPRGREWYRRYYESSISVESEEFEVLKACARDNAVILSVGIIEKDGGTLYCTAVLIGTTGELLSRHRKLIPTAAERLVWGRGAGDGLGVVSTEFGKIGGLICWENYMPAARMALYQQGIEIYIAPNADDLPAWTSTMRHIAKEGRCFVISVNSFVRVSDFPEDYPPFRAESHDKNPKGEPWQKDDILNHGGSCIVGPLGEFVEGGEPAWDREEVVCVDLRMGELVEARMDFDPVGSYSRPDIFTLTVDTKPGLNVAFKG
ncbi:putative nitrilase [Tricladium varicosporioides]|nr:putative nitrilase [Hymenoscyphus varicosporioides]